MKNQIKTDVGLLLAYILNESSCSYFLNTDYLNYDEKEKKIFKDSYNELIKQKFLIRIKDNTHELCISEKGIDYLAKHISTGRGRINKELCEIAIEAVQATNILSNKYFLTSKDCRKKLSILFDCIGLYNDLSPTTDEVKERATTIIIYAIAGQEEKDFYKVRQILFENRETLLEISNGLKKYLHNKKTYLSRFSSDSGRHTFYPLRKKSSNSSNSSNDYSSNNKWESCYSNGKRHKLRFVDNIEP